MVLSTPCRCRCFGAILLLGTLWPAGAAGAGLLSNFAVLRDSAHTETIATVQAHPERFQPGTNGLTAGYTHDVHWLRFTVQRAPGEQGELWLEIQPPYLDDLRLYEPGKSCPDGFCEKRAGDTLPFTAREVPYRAFVFRLNEQGRRNFYGNAADEQPHTYFLRLQTTSTSTALLQLWSPDEFHLAASKEAGFLGFYYGVMAAMLLANLVYWLLLRNPLYLTYCFYLAITVVQFFGLNGFAAQYLLPASPALSDLWVKICVFISSAAGGLFFMNMLSIGNHVRSLLRIFQAQIVIACVSLLSIPLGYFTEAAMLINSINLLLAVVSAGYAFHLFRSGVPGSAFLFASLLLFLAGFFASALTSLGLLPRTTLLAIHGIQIAAAGHVLMMHLAISSRIRSMGLARLQALAQADTAESKAQQERRFRLRQNRFLGMLSHELKTPLAVIDSAVQSLEQLADKKHPEIQRRHQRIRKSVARIDALLDQCLAQDRIDGEGLAMHCRSLDIARLARDAADEGSDDDARITLKTPASLYLEGDMLLLRIALTNLIGNARKYSPATTPIRISVRREKLDADDGVTIEVADGGPGIPASVSEKIFEPFVRGDQQGDIPGAGLGLYLVRRVIELHHGHIDLATGGTGACFRLWLPIKQGAPV
ncbi:MAG: hypothetical protein EPN14_06555 [Gallionella sp.]|nr:MAG: hypothetical protein EPN14_06555 [Gallionella sp.]